MARVREGNKTLLKQITKMYGGEGGGNVNALFEFVESVIKLLKINQI